jgi:hypothetical protein
MKNMKKEFLLFLTVSLLAFGSMLMKTYAATPWSSGQMIEPAELNKILTSPKAPKTYVYCIGYQAIIKNSIDIGPGGSFESQKKLKQEVSKLPKDANIVIYCGCCPFERCPNVSPIFNMLNQLGFKNARILDLPHNIKVDWIDKGYAVKN